MDVDLVSLVKGSPGYEAGGPATKQWQGLFVKSIDQEMRQITAIASTGEKDRDGEIILPSAFKKCLPGYMKNPVILAGHQHKLADGRSPVVGKTVKAWIDKQGLHVVIDFAKTDLAQEYWELYRDKFQRALSVGFRAIKWGSEMIDGRQVPVCKEVDELYEISCVAVGANRDALSRSAKRKRDFVADKRERTGQCRKCVLRGKRDRAVHDRGCDELTPAETLQVERETQGMIDEAIKDMELWERTPESKRSEVFSAEDIEYYTEMDKEAQAFADEILGADAVDEENGTGALVELVMGRR